MNQFYLRCQKAALGLAAVLLTATAAQAQAPAWQSVFVATNSIRAEVNATATDAAGNVYLAGDFSGTIQLSGTTLVSAGGDNGFVAKWSPVSQSFVWAQRLGGTGNDYAQAVAVSGSNVYVGLLFRSPSLVVGSATIANTSTSGAADGLLVKLTDAGSSATVGWAQPVSGADTEAVDALAAVGSSVYVAGSFSSATAQLGGTTLTSAGTSDVFVARFTDAGATASLTWVQRAGGAGFDQADALAVSGGNVYVAGTFEQTATFGSTALVNSTGGQGAPDVFVAKLADAGAATAFTWAVRGGAASSTFARGLAASGSSVYLVGDFSGPTATFGSTVLTNAGGAAPGNDAFIAKLTDAGATGAFTWALAAGGTGYDQAEAVAVRGSSVYITGNFASVTAAFGPTTLTNSYTNARYDVFVARLRDAGPTGAFVWAQAAGGIGNDYARAVALSGSTVFVAGSVVPGSRFGSLVLYGNGPGSVVPLAFLATLNDAAGLASAAATALPGLRLVPNPAHGRVTVQLPAGTGPAALTVLDALGRPVRTYTTASASAELDLTGLAPGVYAVRGQVGAATATQRLVID